MVTTVPALAHQLEYHRLRLVQNEDDGIAAWSFALSHIGEQSMETLRLTPRDLKYDEGIEQLFTDLTGYGHCGASVTLDLCRTGWFPLSSILGLVTVARLWHRQTNHPLVLENLAPQVHAYLERMNIFVECGLFLQASAPPEQRYERSPNSQRLLELAFIPSDEETNSATVRQILRRASSILRSWLSDKALTGSVLTILSEIGQNVGHSGDQGYALIQRHKQPHTLDFEMASEIHIAVADLGVGIEQSLAQRYPDLPRQLHAGSEYILHAFEAGVSGKADARGIGLSLVADLVQQWNGALTVRSNRSQVRISRTEIEVRDDLAAIPGVQVSIIVRGTSY